MKHSTDIADAADGNLVTHFTWVSEGFRTCTSGTTVCWFSPIPACPAIPSMRSAAHDSIAIRQVITFVKLSPGLPGPVGRSHGGLDQLISPLIWENCFAMKVWNTPKPSNARIATT